jgi:hypothetical protein
LIDESNYSYLIKKRGIFGNAESAFENIQRQLVDRFGISETFAEILELKREICELECEVAITDDRFHETFIDMRKHDLEQILKVKGSTNEEIKVFIEKWLGFKLNLHEISVAEWFSYLKQFSASQQTKTAE